jgi:hypothetical protein
METSTLLLAFGYFFPAIVAAVRRHPNATAIFLLDLLLGWTVLGWIGALVWCAIGERSAPQPVTTTSLMRACPYCAEAILPQAVKCKHCGSSLLGQGNLLRGGP